jgi:hypothetical protein
MTTSDEMREMAKEYANVDEVASTCLNALADLTDEVKALREEVGRLKTIKAKVGLVQERPPLHFEPLDD